MGIESSKRGSRLETLSKTAVQEVEAYLKKAARSNPSLDNTCATVAQMIVQPRIARITDIAQLYNEMISGQQEIQAQDAYALEPYKGTPGIAAFLENEQRSVHSDVQAELQHTYLKPARESLTKIGVSENTASQLVAEIVAKGAR